MSIDVVALKEAVLARIMDTKPDLRSPYGLYGYPPMWVIAERADGAQLAVRPAIAQERRNHQWVEVDGVSWQLHKDGRWLDQAMTASWGRFAEHGLAEAIGADGKILLDVDCALIAVPGEAQGPTL